MLEKINHPKDLKSLSPRQLSTLADEIRRFLLSKISKNGGHLASNLGVVELTIALHRYLDSPKDSLIWDVGHQCYVHKILTGRKNLFDNLRTRGGLSGFPDPKESGHDLFKTGHASASISTAMGISETNRRMKKNNKVVAVIGDGSFTGGLALEAINQIGYIQTPMIIVMNDNRMSISENVGALSRYTKRIEKTKTYQELKESIDSLKQACPTDDKEFQGNVRDLKRALKQMGTPGMLFEKLGIHYIGPVDGHSIYEITKALKKTEAFNGPVLIHVRTKKGMGYQFAEEKAEKFHGVSPFILENGNSQNSSKTTYTDIFGKTILKLARKNPKIIGVTAAMPSGTGLNLLANELPKQFFDVGICEGHATAFAAGMAKNGFRPVVAVYSTFLQRALDQIIHDVCLQKLPVIFAIDRAGLVGEDGPTHHGVFDISYLRIIPGMVVMSPRDGKELEMMLRYATKIKRPVAIRYPRGRAENILENKKRDPIMMGKAELIKKGKSKTVISIGNQLGRALKLAERQKNCSIYNARFAKPVDQNLIKVIKKADQAIIIEENVKTGGFASALLEELSGSKVNTKIKILGIGDKFVEHGEVESLRKEFIN